MLRLFTLGLLGYAGYVVVKALARPAPVALLAPPSADNRIGEPVSDLSAS